MTEETAKPYLKQHWSKIYNALNLSRPQNSDLRNDDAYVNKIVEMLVSGHSFYSKTQTESIAIKEFGITNKKTIKELSELAVVIAARKIASEFSEDEAFEKLVDLYKRQPMSTHQTGTSIILAQFSTPIPMSYIMGIYANVNENGYFFEPTAGNGMLTVAGKPENFVVNEIDPERKFILDKQGFKEVLEQDALKPFPFKLKSFDGCVSNPPFGATKNELIANGMSIIGLEQQIIVKSLEYVKDSGKSAFIVGGHTEYDEAGRLKGKRDRGFLSFLAKYYYLEDIINIAGKLYGRQGTFYPTRVILIAGRKSDPSGFYPLFDKNLDKFSPFSSGIIDSYEELWIRTKKMFKKN